MISLIFCLAAVVLYLFGRHLVKGSSASRRVGGDAYAKKRTLKTIGQTLWAIAGLLLVLGIVNLFYSKELMFADVPSSGITAGQLANPPPVPPSHSSAPSASESPTLIERTPMPPSPPLSRQAPETSTASPATPESVAPVPSSTPIPPAPILPINPTQQQALAVEMADANALLQKDPSSAIGYEQRGNIYGQEKKWDLAAADFKHALKIKSTDTSALFDLAEIDFLQRKYDGARAEFLPLEKDPDLGDLASYKVFLCDLAGGHLDAAAKELAVFNQAGSNASYYFANVAWSAYHQKPDDALSWLQSAVNIYSPSKVHLYGTSLYDLGYLPKPKEE